MLVCVLLLLLFLCGLSFLCFLPVLIVWELDLALVLLLVRLSVYEVLAVVLSKCVCVCERKQPIQLGTVSRESR